MLAVSVKSGDVPASLKMVVKVVKMNGAVELALNVVSDPPTTIIRREDWLTIPTVFVFVVEERDWHS